MKQLYLASEIDKVAQHIADDIGEPEKKKLAFIYTSFEYESPEPNWLKQNRKGLVDAGFDLFDYTISGKTPADFDKDLGHADIIHLNGGDTKYLIEKIHQTKFHKWITSKVSTGTIFTSSSAGGIVAGPSIPSFYYDPKEITEEAVKGMSLVNFSLLPHWGRESYKDSYLNDRLKRVYGENHQPFLILNNHQYIKVTNDTYKIVDVRID